MVRNEIENVKGDLNQIKSSQENAYSLAIQVLEQNNKRERFMVKCLLAIITILLLINGYFAYVFTTTTVIETTETTEQSGMYNFYDSEGNMISSDLSLEEMQQLIDLNKEIE